MQYASCLVALNGDITFTVLKPNVTVAEIAVLRAIHGADAIRDIKPLGMDKRSHAEERERLIREYGAARDHKDEPIISKLFPGLSPLPTTFKDIGIEIDYTDDASPEVAEEEEVKKPRKSKKAE